jgi:hypothetical protein
MPLNGRYREIFYLYINLDKIKNRPQRYYVKRLDFTGEPLFFLWKECDYYYKFSLFKIIFFILYILLIVKYFRKI